jgi:hypothetical protein
MRRKKSTQAQWRKPDFQVSPARFPSREDRARWLFGFLGADLGTLSPGQLLEMRRDAWQFVVEGTHTLVAPTPGDGVEEGTSSRDRLPNVSLLKAIQEEWRAGSEKLKKGKWWVLEQPTKYGIARVGERVIRGHYEGTFRDLFLATMLDLVQESWPILFACPRCGNPFVKIGKQQYCSAVCSRKTRWERFKLNRGSRDYRGEREQALRKRLGKNAKIKPGHRRRSGNV